ncbi:MAG: hypothetical protein M0P95_14295 [Sulfuritalea sp.]|jgi:hypothetical protein|nr:hypothetical protein [Sulfuritalea sp.]
MTLSAEQLNKHLLWTALNDLGPLLDQAQIQEGLDAQTFEELARLKAVLAYTGKRLAGADPYLLLPTILDSVSTAISTAATHVRNFISNANASHIVAANLEADKALAALAQLNVQITTEDFVAAKEAAEGYRLSFNKIFSDIHAEASQTHNSIESVESRLTELSTQEAAIKEQLAALTSEHQKQFDTAQETRLSEWAKEKAESNAKFEALTSEYANALSAERQRLGSLITDYQAQFEAGQAARVDEWVTTKAAHESGFAMLLSKYSDALATKETEFKAAKTEIEKLHAEHLEKMKGEFSDSASKIRDDMLELKRQADVLVGIIGDRGVTSGHQKAAEQAREDAKFWQNITVASMVCLIVLAVLIFLPQLAGPFSWESFAGRVFITLTVGVLAAYAGSQADKYQKIERYSRNLALELQAIGPYIAPLPEDKQHEFRLMIGDRTFGREGGSPHRSDEKSPTSVADVIAKSKDLSGFATDIIKTTADVMKSK